MLQGTIHKWRHTNLTQKYTRFKSATLKFMFYLQHHESGNLHLVTWRHLRVILQTPFKINSHNLTLLHTTENIVDKNENLECFFKEQYAQGINKPDILMLVKMLGGGGGGALAWTHC